MLCLTAENFLSSCCTGLDPLTSACCYAATCAANRNKLLGTAERYGLKNVFRSFLVFITVTIKMTINKHQFSLIFRRKALDEVDAASASLRIFWLIELEPRLGTSSSLPGVVAPPPAVVVNIPDVGNVFVNDNISPNLPYLSQDVFI